jgi:hypothetical protein
VLPAIQEEMKAWNLPKDEFEEYGNFPPVIYVREGRRMVGERVFVQKDAQHTQSSVHIPAFEDAVAIGDYSLNSHGTYYTCDRELLGNLSAPTVPFQGPYPVMIPKKIDVLLMPVAVSASRVGFGGIRMEPVWTALGQAAGLAAAQAIEANKQLREIDVTQLQQTLHEKGALTFYTSDVTPGSGQPQLLPAAIWTMPLAIEAYKKKRWLDYDGLAWCPLRGGGNNATYAKPVIDYYDYAKLGLYTLKMVFQPTVAGSHDVDIVYGPDNSINPLIMHLGEHKNVGLEFEVD